MLLETVCAVALAAGADRPAPIAYRDDVDFVLQKIEQVHPAPYLFVQKSTLLRDAEQIKADVPKESLGCAVAKMMALVAELKDGHSYVDPVNAPGLQEWFPIRFYSFPDGLYITAAAPEYAELVGKKVARIGQLSAADAMQKIAVIQAGNNALAAQEGATWLSNAALARALGAASAEMPVTVSTSNGGTLARAVRSFSAELNDAWMQQGEMFGPRRQDDAQLYVTAFGRRGPLDYRKADPALPPHLRYRLPYFMIEMAAARLLYFQWNFVQNWGDEAFPDFTKRLFSVLDHHPDWRLAIDVRYNSGGNGELVTDLIRQIIKRDRFDSPGNLFVITGRKTFSAAVDFVGEAKQWTSAIFVGEPTGAGLNAYGDPQTFETPNLHIRFQISAAYHQHGPSADRSGAFNPDIPAVMHASEYFRGSDPALDAIREGREVIPIPVLVGQVDGQAAKSAYERRRALWSGVPWYVPFREPDMNRAGYHALRAGKVQDAITAFEMNATLYPSSWNVWDSLGEARRVAKDTINAVKSYRKSLDLNPGNQNAKEAIAEMEKIGH